MKWQLETGRPAPLAPGEVVVWRFGEVRAEGRAAALQALLAPDEQARARGVAAPGARAAFTLTRGALRRLLALYLDVPGSELRFTYGPLGKPELPGAGIHFSVSHAADGALIALAVTEVGVDLEQVRARARIERMLARMFAPATRAALHALPEAERLAAFHAAWTQREAYVKAVGGGLFATADRLPFVLPGAAAELVSDRLTGETWTVIPLAPWAGYVATVVLRGIADDIRLLEGSALLPES